MKRHFDINRKIIANMTTEGWQAAPHSAFIYEANVTVLLKELSKYNSTRDRSQKISINSAMLKIIAKGIKNAPKMNSHIRYNKILIAGEIVKKEHIDVSMPMVFDNGKMMTVTLPHIENKSMLQIQKLVNQLRKKAKNTDVEAVLYQTGLNDTIDWLLHGRFIKSIGRLIGAKVGKSKIAISHKRMKASKISAASGKSLSPKDIRQGSITISNVGSICKDWNGHFTLLNIVPPQVCAISIGAVQKKPVVNGDNISTSDIIPLTIVMDHRAIDFNDVVPFMKRIDEILADSDAISAMIN